jgi:M6 family metalloprotease-like protein
MNPVRLPGILSFLLLVAGGMGGVGLLAPAPVEAQDVELLGRIHGTRPPDEYFQARQRPGAFEFQRALSPRLHGVLAARRDAGFDQVGAPQMDLIGRGAPARVVLGPRVGVVQGRFRFPVILGQYADSPPEPAFSPQEVQQEYFTGPNSRYRTIPEFYDEVSGGRVQLEGVTFPWVRTTRTAAQVGGGSSALGSSSQVGTHIMEVLRALDDQGVDWGQFDNDGPDGIPNSGDDDGFVDILIVLHPTRGAECDNIRNSERVWSHRWTLEARMGQGQSFVTSTPSLAPGMTRIRVNDYTIQGLLSCSSNTPGAPGDRINEIGVMAHELGHGFGLPDLYNTAAGNLTGGVGNWDLMATGAWGCTGGGASRPCHMGAWSKAVLGWADVQTLAPDTDHGVLSLPPVNTGGPILQVPAGDGSGEFFLLENRQRIGFDEGLIAPGLLVWQVDPSIVGDRLTPGSAWARNSVNTNRNRPGVWLRQADGRDDLAQSASRGDVGDPFPGATGNRSFHAGSNPASRSHRGTATGLTLLDLVQLGDGAGRSLEFRLLTRFQSISLEVDGGAPGTSFIVDGQTVTAPLTLRSAPFQQRTVEALAGAPIAPGVRAGFEAWSDGGERVRTLSAALTDTVFTARFGRREVQVSVAQVGGQAGIAPGEVQISGASSDGWVPEGAQVTFEARPVTGFRFREWAGALAGEPNPVVRTVSAPLSLEARYDQVFGVATPTTLTVEAARQTQVALVADRANDPVTWSLTAGDLPEGLELIGQVLRGSPLVSGTFPFTLEATDALGLRATAAVTLTVTPPVIGVDNLAGPFLLTQRSPTGDQLLYLDRTGNGNGFYDLGDLRAFVLANPGLPMTSADRGVLQGVISLPPSERGGGGGTAPVSGAPSRRGGGG